MIYIVMLLQHESGTHGQPQRDLIAPMTPPPNPPTTTTTKKTPVCTHIYTQQRAVIKSLIEASFLEAVNCYFREAAARIVSVSLLLMKAASDVGETIFFAKNSRKKIYFVAAGLNPRRHYLWATWGAAR